MIVSEVILNKLDGKLIVYKRPSAEVLAAAFLQFGHDKLLDVIWYSAPVTLLGFLDWAREPQNIVYAGMFQKNGADQVEICGLGWINQKTPIGDGKFKAEVGMGFVRAWQLENIPRDTCELIMDDGFKTEDIAVMYGTTPVPNHAATRFVGKVGMRTVGIAPRFVSWQGKPCDALISAVTKEDWFHERR